MNIVLGVNPVFTNDAIVLGLLMLSLAFVFYTSSLEQKIWKKIYTFLPPLLLCYFIPALLNWPLNLISGDESQLYKTASRYLLPASLIFLCLSIDLKGLLGLGPKALIMFFAATFGVILGGPVAFYFANNVFPNIIITAPDDLWKGMSTLAGSWIGGSANQTAMKEIYQVNDDLFGTMLVIDVILANVWMGFLLYGAGISDKIDRWMGADNTAIESLKNKIASYQLSVEKNPSAKELIILMMVGFSGVGLSHLLADITMPVMRTNETWLNEYKLSALNSDFFWIVLYATTIGLIVSFTKLKQVEGYGASKWGSVFIYILVATIGMKMNLSEVFDNAGLFLIGLIWMLTHVLVLLIVGWIIKAPFFFIAVGSQANIGGAASAPIVASAFSPALAPVGVLMAVLGYALGTYGAILCAQIMAGMI
ncbi:MAG: DUF819 family protein [Saprospiraceae bacterium]|nr:DUF819 family protein [Saprospiraceae bacterium]